MSEILTRARSVLSGLGSNRTLLYAAGGAILLAAIMRPKKAQAMSMNPSMPPTPPIPGQSHGAPAADAIYTDPQYPPNDPKTVLLLQSAARYLNAPVEWANAGSAWHRVLEKESAGWVGRPNYHFGSLATLSKRDQWPVVWNAIRAGTWRDLVLPEYRDNPSSATGLGQLTSSNIPTFYPSGLNGIGKPLEEAIGMLKYIVSRYKTPQAALDFHNAHNWY